MKEESTYTHSLAETELIYLYLEGRRSQQRPNGHWTDHACEPKAAACAGQLVVGGICRGLWLPLMLMSLRGRRCQGWGIVGIISEA